MKEIPSPPPTAGAAILEFKVGTNRVLARDWAAQAVRDIVASGTLYDWAAGQPAADLMHGRGPCYGVTLPAGSILDSQTPVVVRRNRHGGLLRLLTGEHFVLPTRVPLEMSISERLRSLGIPTPEVIACAVYPVAGILGRCDMVTRRLPAGNDLPALWRDAGPAARESLLGAVACLLGALGGAGVRHADLNLKNIYIAMDGEAPKAFLLDVDRVSFPVAGDVALPNFERLARSARKWRKRRGLDFDEAALDRLACLALENT